ncbi:MAG TPA: hypothetical protein VFR65_05980 [Nitrososphaeraceae archaeon]|jgi:hypothetical protein|nr:hypothetical protein [Nitrososphaeraceae archaeon]HSL13827.1 hypothetical protein [Nitrososphaeraceae archaeon]
MPSVQEWKRWFLYQLIGEGVHNAIYHEHIVRELGKYYDSNLDRALRDLIDDGLIMLIESRKNKKYIVNFESLAEAQMIMSLDKNTKVQKNNKIHDHNNVNYMTSTNEKRFVQPYLPEPSGYVYWFDNEENRKFKKQSVYRIYFKETDKTNFAAQLITKPIGSSKIIYMGSINDPNSYISRLWRAVLSVSEENNGGTFILQDIQDKDRMACGNNRQRGKIALSIFKKLGYIQQSEFKGNSIRFKVSGRKPYSITLDEIFNLKTK